MGTPITRRYDPATAVLGPQTPVILEHVAPSTVFVGVWRDGGMAEYAIEMTADDINDASAEPRWFSLPLENEGPEGSSWASFAFPMRFIRMNITTFTVPLELKILSTSDSRC